MWREGAILIPTEEGKTVFNYDRGMDIKAADKDTKAVLEMLLKKFN